LFVKSFPRISACFALFCMLFPALAFASSPAPLFVLNSLDGNVSVIDPATGKKSSAFRPARSPTTCT